MTTKKNLVKSMFMNILTAGIFATSLIACSDELNMMDEAANAPATESQTLMNLEQYGYAVPVEVNAQGDWQIDLQFSDEEREFCYALPDHGHGPATIKLCMLDNWTNERNEGKMIIRDLENAKNDKVLNLRQKCNLDNHRGTRADGEEDKKQQDEEENGDRNNGVGYGYNITKEPGRSAIGRMPILKIEAVKAARSEGVGIGLSSTSAVIRVEQYGAKSISELARKMEVSSNIKGSRGGFSAEASATFSKSQREGSTNMFGLGVVDVKIREAYAEGIDRDNVREYMTSSALKAVDGTGRSYPSTPEGFKLLIETFGSHLIVKADLGGRLRYGTTCDKRFCKSEEEIKAMAACSYKNKIVDANCKASAEQKKTFENNKSHIQTTINALGGSVKATTALYGEGNDTDANVQAWMQSLEDNKNLAVVGFGQKDALELLPLYELVDAEKYPQRYNALKAYMESGLMQDEACEGTGDYTNGDIAKISIPGIDDLMNKYGNGKSLIYEVWDKKNDNLVAVLCTEYIPQISKTSMVQTIYLAENGTPDYKKGRFLGNDDNQACDIEWQEDGTIKHENKAANKGKENTVYILGSQLYTGSESSFSMSRSDIVECTLKGKFMVGQHCNDGVTCLVGATKKNGKYVYDESWINKLKYDNDYHYPLVKIGNRIWLRENFSGNIPHGGNYKQRHGVKVVDGKVFYTGSSLINLTTPKGWRIAKNSDFEDLKNTITSTRSSKTIGEMMQEGGVSGFEMEWNGWYIYSFSYDKPFFGGLNGYIYYDHEHQCPNGYHHMEYYTKEKYPGGHVSITDQSFEIKSCDAAYCWCKQIRLVME